MKGERNNETKIKKPQTRSPRPIKFISKFII